MSERSRLPRDPHAALEMLQAELAETNREVMLLTLEMDRRVEARTAELDAARLQLEKINADLERRVEERTMELRASEERYRLAAARLKEEAGRKDHFLALLGHELRNPLAPIRTAIHLLRSAAVDDSTARIHDVLERQVAHLARLVDDLLDVSRIARGKITLHVESIDIARLVRHAAEDQRHQIESAGLTFSVDVPEDSVWVNGDATRLSQVVGNLLNNARKFTDAGGRVDLRLAPEGNSVRLSVADTGIGIEPDLLVTLFEPFSQSDRIAGRRTGGGLGLGLALVKGLAELHGGTVGAASGGVGKGATFTVELPATGAFQPERHGPTPSAESHWRILIVEDNPDASATLALLLDNSGHTVVEAPDVATALRKAREFNPQVVLSDIRLPGGQDGYDLARTVRADSSFGHPYLVAITGFGQEADRLRAREAGFDVHLTKPVDPETLKRVLADIPRA